MPTDFRSMITTLSYRNQAFINGKYVAAASAKTFDCVSPIDGRVLTQVAECDAGCLQAGDGGTSPARCR